MMPSNHLILCHPLLLLLSLFPSIRVFSNESVLHIRWPKYWSFSFSISPSNEYSGLISFRMDWLDLLAVSQESARVSQGTLKSLLQHQSSKASIFQCSGFFRAQLSHPYMTIGKTIALTRRTFVGKVMCLIYQKLMGLKLQGSSCTGPVTRSSVGTVFYFCQICKNEVGVCSLSSRDTHTVKVSGPQRLDLNMNPGSLFRHFCLYFADP